MTKEEILEVVNAVNTQKPADFAPQKGEVVKHMGTALIVLIPVVTALLNMNNSLITNTLEIKQQKSDNRALIVRVNGTKETVAVVEKQVSAIKEDINSFNSIISDKLFRIESAVNAISANQKDKK